MGPKITDRLYRQLIAAARARPPDEAVPYAFEKRVMAHLRAATLPDTWTLWGGALWRAATPCLALALLLGASAYFDLSGSPARDNLANDLDRTVFAVLEHSDESW